MCFAATKLNALQLASVSEAHQINRQTVVKRALKAALEAEVPGRASDSRNDDFLLVLFL
jgi:hypothetical protein